MNDALKNLSSWVKDHQLWLWVGGALFFVVLIVISSKNEKKNAESVVKKTTITVPLKANTHDSSGLFLGEAVDRKAFVGRLEEQYHNAQEKSHQLEIRIEAMDKRFADFLKSQRAMTDSVQSLESKLTALTAKPLPGDLTGVPGSGLDRSNYRLDVVNINPVSEAPAQGVYLPAGSFVRCTLLTGVYAPVDQNNPLPVLIRLNEAFYGPNETRVPLEGAFVIGKASGDLNSERALVQAVTLSTINPDGKEFQHQGNIGYVTDLYGQLGVKGRVVHNTGGQLAASFMTGFLGGASQAIADGETTAVSSPGGRVTRNVTGDTGKHAAFAGLSQSAAQLSQYYADRVKTIVPAVRVEAGVDVYLVILEGVRINGLHVDKSAGDHFWD